ncbi:signal peptide-containing protein [Pseudofrankia sp. BMG5.37]|uniref:trypsin-like serine peptidase n=1 Tax=Pseudofrankia sp. BMG5.37 TaxID=3050035 RepID=UPI002894CC9C|nr:signal peptide-containing protein [Pseudofrankia sp. BMG5.37]MDT3441293.1 signal peptide-containing protein [Pseudofrankia sp. BMG5.37]
MRSRPGQHRRRRRGRGWLPPRERHERRGPRGPRARASQQRHGRQQEPRDQHSGGRGGPRAGGGQRGTARWRRPWLARLTVAAAAIAVLLLLEPAPSPSPTPGPSGAAGEPPTGVPTAPVTSQRQSQTDEELTRYWTPERRAQAVSGDVTQRATPAAGETGQAADAVRSPGPSLGTSGASGASSGPAAAEAPDVLAPHLAEDPVPGALSPDVQPGVAVPGRVPLAGNRVAPYRGGGLAARAEGALFSTIGGIDYACSGTVVDSPGGDLVLTAGHCLHEGGAAGGFATNVIFIPGYANGASPYGVWRARQLTVTNGWGYRQNFDEDAGFAAFRPLGGRTLEALIGGALPIGFGTGRQSQTVLGYPKLPPYDGTTLMYCSGTPTPDPHGGTSLGVPCSMTAGASGGAWFTGFTGGAGTVDSVVSYAYATDPGTIYGTWFGPAVQDLYQHAMDL